MSAGAADSPCGFLMSGGHQGCVAWQGPPNTTVQLTEEAPEVPPLHSVRVTMRQDRETTALTNSGRFSAVVSLVFLV